MKTIPNRKVWSMIARLWAKDETDFRVLNAGRDGDVSRPLLVLVHPGDAVETEGPAHVVAYSRSCQEGMAHEIENLIATDADTTVLHRLSSHYSIGGSGDCQRAFRAAIDALHRDGAIIYGDDLEKAAAWIEERHLASQRPFVVLAGAWTHYEWGCVTLVGQLLEALGARVVLSRHASVCPGADEAGYRPAGGYFGNPAP